MATRGRPPQRGEGRGRGEPEVNYYCSYLLVIQLYNFRLFLDVPKLISSRKGALLERHLTTMAMATGMAMAMTARRVVVVLPIAAVLVPEKSGAGDRCADADPPFSTTSARFSVLKALIRTVITMWIVGPCSNCWIVC